MYVIIVLLSGLMEDYIESDLLQNEFKVLINLKGTQVKRKLYKFKTTYILRGSLNFKLLEIHISTTL